MKQKISQAGRSAAFSVAWFMAAGGIALMAAAASVSVDSALLWLGQATGVDLLVKGYMLMQWLWGSLVKGVALNFGGPEIAKAVAFWISSGFSIWVGWWTFRRVKGPAMAYFALRMRMGDLDEVKKHAVDIRTIDA